MPRMNAAAGDQTLRIFPYIFGNEVVHLRREADHFRRDVVYEGGAIDADLVQVQKKLLRRAAEFDHLIEIRTLLLHRSKSFRLEHLDGLDVNVAVGDHRERSTRCRVIVRTTAFQCKSLMLNRLGYR